MAKLSQLYLFLYNAAQAVGWTACLVHIILGLLAGQQPSSIYSSAGLYARIFQLLSSLEVLHAASGLVPSSPVNALMQWAGRSNVLFPILAALPEVQATSWGVVLLTAWSLAEVVRYPWYAATIFSASPDWLTWLRYTAFIPLYPVGVVAEMTIIWVALPTLQARHLYSIALPNAYNFAFDYVIFLKVLLLGYPFLWWQLYSTLLRQRAKRLGGGHAKAQ